MKIQRSYEQATLQKTEAELVFNVSHVQQGFNYTYFFRFFSIIGYYKVLKIVPCAIQQVLVVYLFYKQEYVSVSILSHLLACSYTLPIP